MYNGLAEQYNKDIEHSTKMISTISQPVMIIFIGGIVGFIMIAMYSPIFNLSQILERWCSCNNTFYLSAVKTSIQWTVAKLWKYNPLLLWNL